jgi:hypothetical protein
MFNGLRSLGASLPHTQQISHKKMGTDGAETEVSIFRHGNTSASVTPQPANCYSCHAAHRPRIRLSCRSTQRCGSGARQADAESGIPGGVRSLLRRNLRRGPPLPLSWGQNSDNKRLTGNHFVQNIHCKWVAAKIFIRQGLHGYRGQPAHPAGFFLCYISILLRWREPM